MMPHSNSWDSNKSPQSPFDDDNRFQEINLSRDSLAASDSRSSSDLRETSQPHIHTKLDPKYNLSLQIPKKNTTRTGPGGSILKKNSSSSSSGNRTPNVKIIFSDHDANVSDKEGVDELTRTTSGSSSLQPTPVLAQPHARFDHYLDTASSFAPSTHSDDESAVLPRKGTVMKRHRWGTRRDKKGAPIGRTRTLRWKKSQHRPFNKPFDTGHNDHPMADDNDEEDPSKNRANELRSIYFNMPLPLEMQNENGEPLTDYPRNKIRTTKYTPLSFLPKNLAFQFKNIANIFFLAMIIMGFFNIFGVPNPGLSVVPLAVIVMITAIKDAIEDSQRTVLDMEVNNTPTHILHGVENPNTSEDNISEWRKFKKLNTQLIIRFIKWYKIKFTEKGKEEARLQQLTREATNNRKSFDDYYGDPRKSFQMDDLHRIDTTLEDPFGDSNQTFSMNDTIIDRSIQVPPNAMAKFEKDNWKNVNVGDIVRIHNNDEIPADVILLSTSDSDGACYIETKNLDGETNLKVRQALKVSMGIRRAKDIQRSKFWVESEGPHANLYNYQGNLKWTGDDAVVKNEPVSINNVLLRGCFLRNTKWAIGIVVFSGSDTKIMLNSGETPSKKSRISTDLNYTVFMNFIFLFIICFVSGLVNGISYNETQNSRDYFEYGTIAGTSVANGIVGFFVAVILYQSLVPISLYISIEIIKTAQAFFIYSDVNMYYPPLDYPCTPKSWNISDDLGQIEYIFSDKTGTLTQNVMEFKKCTINGVSYGRAYTEALAGLRKRQGVDVEEESSREKKEIAIDKEVMIQNLSTIFDNPYLKPDDVTFISKEFVEDLKGGKGDFQKNANKNFMLALALCHSVLTEKAKNDPTKIVLKAQSPDEAALVATARDFGYAYTKRTKKGVVVNVQGVEKEFQVLNVLEFNSTRKRMSAIIKIPPEKEGVEPTAMLICKGADSIIYSRLSKNCDDTLLEKTALHLEQYASEGLRTLCIAKRDLSWPEYIAWNKKHEVASAALVKRDEKMEEVADSIERELQLLGGTAIEDRLQEGVPDTIELLAHAGIKLWVLTGDKVETAINIGFSCNLLGNDMELLVLKTTGDDVENISKDPKVVINYFLSKYLKEKFNLEGSWEEIEAAKHDHGPPTGNYAVIIDGEALKIALQGECMRKFLLLCKQCKAVLCCRVSPAQKASVVKMVKDTLDVMTLAIGDGSNDVAMIQAADIGVGIAGEEGRQAVMSSDYAVGQFRYLARLILVHGRWSYKRLSEMIPSFFYKNVIFTIALFWYGVHNQFDGTYLFEYTYLMFYNLAYTSLPVIFMGIFDQDVSDVVSLVVPQLYTVGILRSEWTIKKFWCYMCDGLYQSLICYFFPYFIYYKTGMVTHNGLGLDHRYWIGTLVASIAVISCNLYITLHLYSLDWLTCSVVFISIILIFAWNGIWSSTLTSAEYYKGAAQVFGSTIYWAGLVSGVIACLLPRFIIDVCRNYFFPKDIDIIRECVSRGDFSQYPKNYDPTDPNRIRISKYSAENVFESNSSSEITMKTHDRSSSLLNKRDSALFTKRESKRLSYPFNNQDVKTQEIEMEYDKTNGTPRLRQSDPSSHNALNVDLDIDYIPRTSLDRTRLSMIRDNQMSDRRLSVENARASLDLPGLTRANSLLQSRR